MTTTPIKRNGPGRPRFVEIRKAQTELEAQLRRLPGPSSALAMFRRQGDNGIPLPESEMRPRQNWIDSKGEKRPRRRKV